MCFDTDSEPPIPRSTASTTSSHCVLPSAAGEMKAPILGLQAGADQHITSDQKEEFERALQDAGVEHDKQDEFQDASDDAWRRTLEFIEQRSSK